MIYPFSSRFSNRTTVVIISRTAVAKNIICLPIVRLSARTTMHIYPPRPQKYMAEKGFALPKA